jgi:hypothetical protein
MFNKTKTSYLVGEVMEELQKNHAEHAAWSPFDDEGKLITRAPFYFETSLSYAMSKAHSRNGSNELKSWAHKVAESAPSIEKEQVPMLADFIVRFWMDQKLAVIREAYTERATAPNPQELLSRTRLVFQEPIFMPRLAHVKFNYEDAGPWSGSNLFKNVEFGHWVSLLATWERARFGKFLSSFHLIPLNWKNDTSLQDQFFDHMATYCVTATSITLPIYKGTKWDIPRVVKCNPRTPSLAEAFEDYLQQAGLIILRMTGAGTQEDGSRRLDAQVVAGGPIHMAIAKCLNRDGKPVVSTKVSLFDDMARLDSFFGEDPEQRDKTWCSHAIATFHFTNFHDSYIRRTITSWAFLDINKPFERAGCSRLRYVDLVPPRARERVFGTPEEQLLKMDPSYMSEMDEDALALTLYSQIGVAEVYSDIRKLHFATHEVAGVGEPIFWPLLQTYHTYTHDRKKYRLDVQKLAFYGAHVPRYVVKSTH